MDTGPLSASQFDEIHETARLLALLGIPIHMELLCALATGEADVGTLSAMTGREVSHVSRHLVRLRDEGLLERRLNWKRHVYRLRAGVEVGLAGTVLRVMITRRGRSVCVECAQVTGTPTLAVTSPEVRTARVAVRCVEDPHRAAGGA